MKALSLAVLLLLLRHSWAASAVATPATVDIHLAPPARVWIEPFAVTPISIKEPFNLDALAIMARLQLNKQRIGVDLTSPTSFRVIGKFLPAVWVVPGSRGFAMRKGIKTCSFIVSDHSESEIVCDLVEDVVGVAPGDKIYLLDEFARVTPRVCWTTVPTATAYRVERYCRHTAHGEMVYEGPATCYADPALRDALGTKGVYDYRVSALRGATCSPRSLPANNTITETPLRALIAQCRPHERPGTPAYMDLLFDALRNHPSPAMRLCAAWEIGHTGDAVLTHRLLPLLDSADAELVANTRMALNMLGEPSGGNPALLTGGEVE